MHGEDLALVLMPGLHWELVDSDVEELNGAVARCSHKLIFMDLGPRQVVQGVLGVEPTFCVSSEPRSQYMLQRGF